MKTIILCLISVFFTLKVAIAQNQQGYASYYGKEFHGRRTASGEKYNMRAFTAAHRTLPFGTLLKVTNISNNQTVIVKINDRGPFSKKRLIDISRAAAEEIDMINDGVVRVEIETLPSIFTKEDSLKFFPKYDSLKLSGISKVDSIVDFSTLILGLEVGKHYNNKCDLKKPQGYGIQVLSIGDIKKLINEIDTLQIRGFDKVYIEPATVGTKKSFRILVGQYVDKSAAQNDKIKLEQMGYNGFVRKYIAVEKPK